MELYSVPMDFSFLCHMLKYHWNPSKTSHRNNRKTEIYWESTDNLIKFMNVSVISYVSILIDGSMLFNNTSAQIRPFSVLLNNISVYLYCKVLSPPAITPWHYSVQPHLWRRHIKLRNIVEWKLISHKNRFITSVIIILIIKININYQHI